MSALLVHPCAQVALGLATTEVNKSVHLYTVFHCADRCGIEFGVDYYPRSNCSDGKVDPDSHEYCDDGNTVSGDGCSSRCLIEVGYTCTAAANGTSVCRMCADDCATLHRDVCSVPGGQCGGCADGYGLLPATDGGGGGTQGALSYDGVCGKIYRVFYAAVDMDEIVEEPVCTHVYIGTVLEPDDYPYPQRYIDLVNSALPDRDRTPPTGLCNLRRAVETGPVGDDVACVAEVLTDHSFDVRMDLTGHIVVFSEPREGHRMPVIQSSGSQVFDVFASSTFLLYHVVIRGAAHSQGGAVRTYGGTVHLLDVVLDESLEIQNLDNREIEFACEGDLILNGGRIMLEDVVVSNNNFHLLESYAFCLKSAHVAILSYGDFVLRNVTFESNYVIGNLVHLAGASGTMTDVTLRNNFAETGSLFVADVPLTVAGLTTVNNTGAMGALFSLSGMADVAIENFEISETRAMDKNGIIYNLSLVTIRSGRIRDSHLIGPSALIVNGASLQMENVNISRTSGTFLDTSVRTTLSDCHVSNTSSYPTYSAIRNEGALVIDGSKFIEATDSVTPYIETTEPVIVRDSDIPATNSTFIATCDTEISGPFYWETKTCGTQALCAPWEPSGVHCSCRDGDVGNPTTLCGSVATLYVLPQTSIDAFRTKAENVDPDPTSTRVLAAGFGAVMWSVDVSTLPTWLALSPSSGTFASEGLCADEPIDMEISFLLEHITGDAPLQHAVVVINATAYYSSAGGGVSAIDQLGASSVGETFLVAEQVVFLDFMLEVEVVPSPLHSRAMIHSVCLNEDSDNFCEVDAEKSVAVAIDVRDAAGYSLGVGGHTPEIRVQRLSDCIASLGGESVSLVTFALADYANGSFRLTFDAPTTHFCVHVRVVSEDVQESPLLFHVRCPSGDHYDDAANECVRDSISIPRPLIALGLLCTFVLALVTIRIVRGTRLKMRTDWMEKEAAKTLLAMFINLADIGTDLSAYLAIQRVESVESYIPAYFAVLCVGCLASAYAIISGVLFLRSIMKDSSRYVTSTSRPTRRLQSTVLVSGVAGVSKLVCEDDAVLVLKRLCREYRGDLHSLMLLVVEDIPMQVFNVIFLETSGSVPFAVVISMQVTSILIGVKLTKLFSVWKNRKIINRIRLKTGL
eukprot:Rmarinus@m.27527